MSPHLRDILLVAAGGAIGSVMRYGVGKLVGPQADASVPWHTFAVNVTGAFVLGLLIVAAARQGWPGWWRPLVGVGVLGGYTTFSTFSLEVVELGLHGAPWLAAGYAGLSLAAGIAGAAAGIFLGRAVL
ncbi:MAG TPA: fluoride efflux transporter CrcB [Coriobacteriia bacterium]